MPVTVYTLPNCVQCDTTKRMLDNKNIQYNTIDLTEDDSAYQMVKSLGYQSAPVVIAGDEHWSGFRIEKINALAVRYLASA